MERYQKTIDINSITRENCLAALPDTCGRTCFFDIETTGLSPKVSSLSLIGACHIDGDTIQLIQWFADDYISEKEMLESFSLYLHDFDTIVHYNGSTFDIPYLEKKYLSFHLESPFMTMKSLDIYREIRKRKTLFHTENMKLVSMERLLNFRRNDHFSGKDCIQLYTDYMQKKYFRDEDSLRLKNLLLLHNHDDLCGTFLCSQLLYFSSYRVHAPSCHFTPDSLDIEDTLSGQLPFETILTREDGTVSFSGNKIQFSIPLFHGTLYHFYKDYKNYFYLPDEDMAVHKSVGIYVDATHRQKASAANCYTKKTGTFLPLPKKLVLENVLLFQETKKSSVFYVDTDSLELTTEQIAAYLDAFL